VPEQDLRLPPSPRDWLPVVDADMLAYVLDRLGQDVRLAYSAATAVTTAREHCPRIAFLDDGMSGSALAHNLRQEFPVDELTLVAVTGTTGATRMWWTATSIIICSNL
jgi:ActR/RegA family two-component response regulator